MERPFFPVETILVGTYSVGYNPRYNYYKVKGHTKSKAPKVVELKKKKVSEYSTPADSEIKHTLSEDLEEVGSLYTARWGKNDKHWGIAVPIFEFSREKKRVKLEQYQEGKVYTENSYY